MIKTCETCKNNLGGGYDNCKINLEPECAAGGFEAWERKKLLYIAGPMTGLPDLGRKAFNDAERELRERGYLVLNPACLPTDLPDEAYMPICFAMLEQCDAIVMMPGWEHSIGATLEVLFATQQNKEKLLLEALL